MALMTPKEVKKVLELLLSKHYIARRYPAYCVYDKKHNPVMKLTEKRLSKLSVALVEKDKKFTVSKKMILSLHGGNIIKTTYKEIRCLKKQQKSQS